MKIGIFGDVHWSKYSSIIRSNGEKYSTRLENLIKSLNWAEDLFNDQDCKMIVGVGDFFDRSDLDASEISALNEIKWHIPKIPHYFLCGNHEMQSGNHFISSAKLFELLPESTVIDQSYVLDLPECELCFLPYQLELNRKSITEYFGKKSKPRIIFSHNDIAGINYGGFLSKSGFDISDIEANCNKFINGHLHNGEALTKKIFNIGNLSGQNFTEDATKYEHVVFILDTESLSIEVFENPYAFNFYKLLSLDNIKLKPNSVVTLKCTEATAKKNKLGLDSNPNVVSSRVIVEIGHQIVDTSNIEDFSVDHVAEFKKYILSVYNSSDLVQSELEELFK